MPTQKHIHRTPLVVQSVRLCAPSAGGLGSIPRRVTRSCMHVQLRVRTLQ